MVASYVVVEVDLARGLVVALGTGVPDLLVLNLHRYTGTQLQYKHCTVHTWFQKYFALYFYTYM